MIHFIAMSGTSSTTLQMWKQDKNVLRVNNPDTTRNFVQYVRFWSNDPVFGSETSPAAEYIMPIGASYIYIDVTDYVRTFWSATTIMHLKLVGQGSSYEKVCYVTHMGLINPNNVIRPYTFATYPGNTLGFSIQPPRRNLYEYYIAESRIANTESSMFSSIGLNFLPGPTMGTGMGANLSTNNQASALNVAHPFQVGTTPYSLQWYAYGRTLVVQDIDVMDCDKEYCFVKWVSFTGTTRAHVFEVIKKKMTASDSYGLLDITQNLPKEIKGRAYEFTLFIDQLNAYDLWYYADMIGSSDVQVSFAVDSRPWAAHDWHPVQVLSKNATAPDGNAGTDGKLEINVKYDEYDAVAL